MIKISYPGVYPWARARRKGNRYWDSQATLKESLAPYYKQGAMNSGFPILSAIGAILIFYKQYPKRFAEYKKNEICFWNTKPDIDNLEKFVFDLAQKQAGIIKEDSKVCAKFSLKLWGPESRTVIYMDEWNGSSRIHFIDGRVYFNGKSFELLVGDSKT